MKWTELIIAILLLIVTVREGAYLVISSLGRHEQRRGNSHAALQWYRDASDEWFSRDMLLSQADLQRSQNDYAGAQITAMRSLAINSFDGRAWRLLGDIQLQAKETALASESFSRAFAINKYNDLGPLHGMLAIAASTRNMRMADALHGETDMLLTKFVHAIKVNAHFIALSSNVEDLEKIADLLSSLYPNSAGRYQRMKGDVRMAAQKERSYLHARTPGILW